MDSWANLGREREKEREESEGMRERRMLEAKVNEYVWGGDEKRAGEVNKVFAAHSQSRPPRLTSLPVGPVVDRRIASHTGTDLDSEKVLEV